MANFSGSFISDTYQRVIQLDTTLQDGTGSLIQSLPVTASNAISASYAISSSHEIIKEVSSSIADTASFVEYGNVANKPTLLSSSAQIADDISGSFTSISASFSTTITFNSSSASTDIAALVVDSSSFSTRITNLVDVTGSYATTGSNQFSGNIIISSSQVLTLEPVPILPTGQATGSIVISGSEDNLALYMFAGTGSFGDGYLKIAGSLV
jgi:hypothetical protein